MENYDDLFVDQENQQPDRDPGDFDKEAWAARKQQERVDLFTRIDAYAMEMTGQGEDIYVAPFQTYLDVQARFDRYSVGADSMSFASLQAGEPACSVALSLPASLATLRGSIVTPSW